MRDFERECQGGVQEAQEQAGTCDESPARADFAREQLADEHGDSADAHAAALRGGGGAGGGVAARRRTRGVAHRDGLWAGSERTRFGGGEEDFLGEGTASVAYQARCVWHGAHKGILAAKKTFKSLCCYPR